MKPFWLARDRGKSLGLIKIRFVTIQSYGSTGKKIIITSWGILGVGKSAKLLGSDAPALQLSKDGKRGKTALRGGVGVKLRLNTSCQKKNRGITQLLSPST